jgi:hypothetical protein
MLAPGNRPDDSTGHALSLELRGAPPMAQSIAFAVERTSFLGIAHFSTAGTRSRYQPRRHWQSQSLP